MEQFETYALALYGALEGAWKYTVRPNLGKVAIGALTASIVAHNETLERHPVLTCGAIGIVALHLAAPRYDPLTIAYDIFK